MKWMFTLVLGIVLFTSQAQVLTLRNKITSVNVLETEANTLAKMVIPIYKHPDPLTYLDNLFRIQLAGTMYEESIRAIDSFQRAIGLSSSPELAAVGIQFRAYAYAMQKGAVNDSSFLIKYQEALSELYERLPASAKSSVGTYFSGDTIALGKQLNQFIGQIGDRDQIELEEAVKLLRVYNSYNVYRLTLKPALAFLDNEDNKNYIVEDNLLLPGANGARISAVIVRPKQMLNGKAAVILVNNIYAGNGDRSLAKEAAAKGYVGIVINPRGKKNSPDKLEPYEHDGEDIYAVLDWISHQSWCNGSAAMYGGSYLGFSQWAAVKKVHPILKTIVPQVAVGSGIDFPRFNGAYYGYALQWIHYISNNKLTDYGEFSDRERWEGLFKKWYLSGLPFNKLDSLDGRPNELFQRWLEHANFDSYWQRMIPFEKDFAAINIPILTITGYFDDDQRGALHYYFQHHKWNAKADHYLYIGPFDHGGGQSAAVENVRGYSVDSAAMVSISELVWDWFDHVLRGQPRPSRLKDKITYQVMGTNEWRSARNYEELSNDSIVFYLSHTYTSKGFKMQTSKPVIPSWMEQVIDLQERPIDASEPMILSESKPEAGDQLVFISEPLIHDMVLNGSMEGKIQLILNKRDTDLAFDLYEYTPDSSYFLLSSTTQRLSYIRNAQKRQLLNPGQLYNIPIYNSTMTSKLIKKGSRLLLYAGFDRSYGGEVNYGSGKPVHKESIADGKEPLVIKWGNQSYIKLRLYR